MMGGNSGSHPTGQAPAGLVASRVDPGRWQPIETAPDGVVVETKIDDMNGERNIQRLKRRGRLWFVPDGSTYIYYQPTHWRPA